MHFLSGGGLSIAIHLGCALLSVVLFVVALRLWFGTGNQAAPIVVWLGPHLPQVSWGTPIPFPGKRNARFDIGVAALRPGQQYAYRDATATKHARMTTAYCKSGSTSMVEPKLHWHR